MIAREILVFNIFRKKNLKTPIYSLETEVFHGSKNNNYQNTSFFFSSGDEKFSSSSSLTGLFIAMKN